MAAASAVVSAQRDGRFAGGGFQRWRRRMRCIGAWTRCWSTGRRSSAICGSAGRICSGRSSRCLLYDLTSTYFESDPPFPEGDKRQLWLQPGQAAGLRASGHRAGGHAGRFSAGLRSDGRATRRQDHAARLSQKDRRTVRQGRAHLGDGPGHSDRGSAGARCGPAIRRCTIWWARPRDV